jgi:excinuclease ABC subunit C
MVISLAKREEEIYVQARSGPVKLSRTNAGLKLLQHIRDEAHRFGQSYHHLLISKKRFEGEVAAGRRPPKSSRKKKENPAVPASERKLAEEETTILSAEQLRALMSNRERERGDESATRRNGETANGCGGESKQI